MKYALGTILLLVGLCVIAVGIYVQDPLPNTHDLTVQPAFPEIIEKKPSPTQPVTMKYSATIRDDQESVAFKSLASASSILERVYPTWYIIDIQGHITAKKSVLKNEMLQLLKESGIKIIPTIKFTKEILPILTVKEKNEVLMHSLLDLIENNKYDGLDIDLQQMPTEFFETMYPFFQTISRELSSHNKQFSFTIAITENDGLTAKKYDWSALKTYAPIIRVSPYSFENPSSKSEPILSASMYSNFLKTLKSIFPSENTYIILPTLSYELSLSSKAIVSYTDSLSAITKARGSWEIDSSTLELTGTYNDKGVIKTVWAENAESIIQKITIAKEQGVSHFSFWYIGGEDPKLWGLLLQH